MSNNKKQNTLSLFQQIDETTIDPEFLALFENLNNEKKLLFLVKFSHKLGAATFDLLDKFEVVKISLGLDKTMINYMGKKQELNEGMIDNILKTIDRIMIEYQQIQDSLKKIVLHVSTSSNQLDIS